MPQPVMREPWPSPESPVSRGFLLGCPADHAGDYLQVCYPDQGDCCWVEGSGLQGRWAGKPSALLAAQGSNGEKRKETRIRLGIVAGTCRVTGLCSLAVHGMRSVHTSSCMSVNWNDAFLLPPPTGKARLGMCRGDQKLLSLKAIVASSLKEPSREPTQLSGCSCTY